MSTITIEMSVEDAHLLCLAARVALHEWIYDSPQAKEYDIKRLTRIRNELTKHINAEGDRLHEAEQCRLDGLYQKDNYMRIRSGGVWYPGHYYMLTKPRPTLDITTDEEHCEQGWKYRGPGRFEGRNE